MVRPVDRPRPRAGRRPAVRAGRRPTVRAGRRPTVGRATAYGGPGDGLRRGRERLRSAERVRVEPRRLPQRPRLVGLLPGEVVVLAPEVAVGGGLLVDRPVQVEVAPEGP